MKKEADKLRIILREIPRSTYIMVDDCRYLAERETFIRQKTDKTGSYSLYFVKQQGERKVILLGDSEPFTIPLCPDEEILSVFFSLSPMKESINPLFNGPLIDSLGPMEWYQDQFSFLYHEHLDCLGEFRRGLCSSLVHIILSQLVLSSGEFARPSYNRSDLIKICQIIKNHPEKRHTLYELAEKAHLSPRHFSRLFTKELGITPKGYELIQRMAYARYLLLQKGLNVQETSERCGYTDPFLFSRQFKKIYGFSPGKAILQQPK